jgi:hypothetical protein
VSIVNGCSVADVAQREYNALITIGSMLGPAKCSDDVDAFDTEYMVPRRFIYSNAFVATKDKDASDKKSSTGFGFVLSSDTSTIRITSSEDYSCVQGYHRHCSDGWYCHLYCSKWLFIFPFAQKLL